MFYEKRCSWKIRKSHRKIPLVCEIFKSVFFAEHFCLFRAMLLKWGTVSHIWKTSDEYSLSINTNLRSTVQVHHFFFRQDKLSVYVFIDLHCLLPEATIRVELFYKKGALKDFVNFIGKHLCWSLFSITLQAWHPFWRTSANDCFCTALAPLNIVTYPFYFTFSTFFLIIAATTVNIADICFWFKFFKGFKEFKSAFSFSLKSILLLLIFFPCFFLSFSVLFHFFLSLLIKRILLSWELIKTFLLPLTSLKYVSKQKVIYILWKWC